MNDTDKYLILVVEDEDYIAEGLELNLKLQVELLVKTFKRLQKLELI